MFGYVGVWRRGLNRVPGFCRCPEPIFGRHSLKTYLFDVSTGLDLSGLRRRTHAFNDNTTEIFRANGSKIGGWKILRKDLTKYSTICFSREQKAQISSYIWQLYLNFIGIFLRWQNHALVPCGPFGTITIEINIRIASAPDATSEH